MNAPIDWLLQGESWVEYRTRIDLLGQTETDLQVAASRDGMLKDPHVKRLMDELTNWPWTVISSHKSAGQPFHKLTFIADLGFLQNDLGIETIAGNIFSRQSSEGPFQLPMNIPKHFGGSGEDEWAWALCDTPLLLYALIKFGYSNPPQVQAAINHLKGLIRSNGWPCSVSKELGKFRGPGRKDDPCPFATLAMLKVLAVCDAEQNSEAAHIGVETLLSLWTHSQTQHPFMFFMGSDFRKLKVPLVWYDLIHVLDVLSRFPWVMEDPRYQDMVGILKNKADDQGRFTSESVWTAWKDWEFGQKKAPSRWLTFHAWRILHRQ